MHAPSTAKLHALVLAARQARGKGYLEQGHSVEVEGQPCVLKWAQPKPWATGRSWLAMLVGWLAFGERVAPSALRTGGLMHEARRLNGLRAAGRRVPRVLLQTDDCLVLSAVGTSLDRIVPQLTDAEKIALFERIADDLADWHVSGHWHGGAQLRNVTLYRNQLYRIDFEEQHGHVLSPVATRIYDLLLFFGDALARLNADEVLAQGCLLVQRYLNRLTEEEVAQIKQRLPRLLRLLQPLLWVDAYCPYLTRRRDKQRVLRFARVMHAILINPPPAPGLVEIERASPQNGFG